MSLTVKQAMDFVRLGIGEQKFSEVPPSLQIKYIDLAQLEVLKDMLWAGLKRFTKTAYLSGYITNAPSDLMPLPNAVIEIYTSSGTRRIMANIADANNWDAATGLLIATFREPGTNAYTISFSHTASTGQNPTVSISGSAITIVIESSVTLPSSIVTAIANEPIVNNLLSMAVGSVATALIIDDTGLPATMPQSTAGSGNGWFPADELKIEDFKRLQNNTYAAAVDNVNPQFRQYTNSNGSNIFEFAPTTTKYSMVTYYNQFTELTAQTDTISLPRIFEPLLLDKATMVYARTLKMQEKLKEATVDYETKLQSFLQGNQNTIASKQGDNTRIEAQNPNN